MITEIKYTHPSPTINLGGSPIERSADITFDVCIDSTELTYKKVKFEGLPHNNWTMNDLVFIEATVKMIGQLNGKKLKDVTEISSIISKPNEKGDD